MIKKIWNVFVQTFKLLFEDPGYNHKRACKAAYRRLEEDDRRMVNKMGLDPYSRIDKGNF